jgi:predicted NBD/HSP70 family sugar kinase
VNEFSLISSSPRRIRQTNGVAALQALYRYGCLSRAQLARKMGLNRSSSGHIIAEFTASGLVREIEEGKARRSGPAGAGRPGILLELVPDAACFLGAEIGVEHITTVLIDLTASILRCHVEPFDGPSVAVADAIACAVEQAFGDLTKEMVDRCEGFGLSAPAQMDAHGRISVAPLLGWKDVNFAQLARAALPIDVPIIVENDANAFAIGEGYKRSEGRSGVTLFLVIESGVGGGIVIDGKLFRGGHGLAGEIGHILVTEGGQELEQLIGLERLLTQYRQASARQDAGLADFLADVRDRVPHAVSIAEEWARLLAFALVQACRLIDPDRIVLGGSVAALYPMVAARVAAYVQAGQAPTFPLPGIVLDESAESGSAFGAACMLHQRFLSLANERFAEGTPHAQGAASPEGTSDRVATPTCRRRPPSRSPADGRGRTAVMGAAHASSNRRTREGRVIDARAKDGANRNDRKFNSRS